MNPFLFKVILRSRYFLALLAGLMLAASFPKLSVAGFAWIAPGLILFCGAGKNGRQQFWIGYAAGVAHYLSSLYWLLNIPFPAGAIAGWLALSAYLALYPATWVWLCWKIFQKFSTPIKNPSTDEGQNISIAENFLNTTWTRRAIWSLCCAAIWVALEMTIARLFSGFPWNFLGITQYKMVPLIQIASITGVYGVSFLLVWFSVSLCATGLLLIQKPGNMRIFSSEVALPALAAALLFSFGFNQTKREIAPERELKLALIQPSIPQTLIFDPSQSDSRFEQLLHLSEQALAEKPDVLVWPEAAMPPIDENRLQALTNFIAAHRVWLIVGADDAGIRARPDGKWETNYYNSSFLFSPDGTAVASYRKQHLVIFGEYVPLSRWVPFMKWLTPIQGGFTAGAGPLQFQTTAPRAKMSVLICFEDGFPHYVREHVETDTDFLLNLTNDGWFGNGAAQWQQAANALFRAVENGLPLVRCTNNGLTCWIDKFGRLRKIFAAESNDIYGKGFLMVNVPLLGPGEKRALTFYRQHGDWFGWSCLAVTIGLLILTHRKSGRRRLSASA